MKEILAFIRVNKVADTKKALDLNGFAGFCCRKCLGRGKKPVLPDPSGAFFAAGDSASSTHRRLIAKRLFSIVVADDEVPKVVKLIIDANRTGAPGDGKIFVLPVYETCCIRTGQRTSDDL